MSLHRGARTLIVAPRHRITRRIVEVPNLKKDHSGIVCVLSAYALWGILPLYWKLLAAVPAQVILAQRTLWSVVFLGLVLLMQKRTRATLSELRQGRVVGMRALAALFVTGNWLTYVWAMGHGYIVEAGLGYFICPLFSVALAAIVLGERLSGSQSIGVATVSLGVLLKIFYSGTVPWVALLLAGTWALYSMVKKAAPAEPVESLFQEVLLAFPLIAVAIVAQDPQLLFHSYGYFHNALLVLSGPITAIPILLLVHGLRHLPLRHTALIQFLTPTLNVVVAFLAGETFGRGDLYCFILIWLGIGFYLGAGRSLLRRFRANGFPPLATTEKAAKSCSCIGCSQQKADFRLPIADYSSERRRKRPKAAAASDVVSR